MHLISRAPGSNAALAPHDPGSGLSGKIVVFLNPHARSGDGKGLSRRLEHLLRGLEVQIVSPPSREALVALARDAVASGAAALVAVGGDGTLNALLPVLKGSCTALGVIPRGTANDLATHLGIPPDLPRACTILREGKVRQLDLLTVNGIPFVTGGGLGVACDTATGVDRLKAGNSLRARLVRSLGGLVYVLYSFGLLAFARTIDREVTVHVDGAPWATGARAIAFFVNNQPFIGKTIVTCPQARSDDGMLDVCLMRRRSRLGAILTVVLMSLKGAHTRRQDITLSSGQQVTVTSPRPLVFMGDGEVLAQAPELELAILPGALCVLVP